MAVFLHKKGRGTCLAATEPSHSPLGTRNIPNFRGQKYWNSEGALCQKTCFSENFRKKGIPPTIKSTGIQNVHFVRKPVSQKISEKKVFLPPVLGDVEEDFGWLRSGPACGARGCRRCAGAGDTGPSVAVQGPFTLSCPLTRVCHRSQLGLEWQVTPPL